MALNSPFSEQNSVDEPDCVPTFPVRIVGHGGHQFRDLDIVNRKFAAWPQVWPRRFSTGQSKPAPGRLA